MKRYSLYLFDLDGTLYRGSEVVPHGPQVVQELYRDGAHIRYLTNNSAARRQEVHAKLAAMGYPCRPEWVAGTGYAAAEYCQRQEYSRVFVVGEPQLHQTMGEHGLAVSQGPEVDAVVVGVCRSFSYRLLDEALQCLLAGAAYVATNGDTTYPLEGGRLQPGAGALVAAVSACSGREPFTIGKPNPWMAHQCMQELGVEVHQTIMVGDRWETDIECGLRAGCDTFLVLTGITEQAPEGQLSGPDLRGLIG